MSLGLFKAAPWRTSAKAYEQSALAIRPAPEYANSEVLIAALYREVGFKAVSEGRVPGEGRALTKRLEKGRAQGQATVGIDTWLAVVHGVLESPKMPSQSTKRFYQMSPVVPEVARYSGSARLSDNSWPAGQLIQRMVWLGSRDKAAARWLWHRLFMGLAVGQEDDVWAEWLQKEFESWRERGATAWAEREEDPQEVSVLAPAEAGPAEFPAAQFVKDLEAVLDAKGNMTRRQWVSLLESVVRVAAVGHVMWLCDVQHRIWRYLSEVLDGGPSQGKLEVAAKVFPSRLEYFSYGNAAMPAVKDYASRYLSARLGINTILWGLHESGWEPGRPLSSSDDVAELAAAVHDRRVALHGLQVRGTINELLESEARTLACRKGIGSNLVEFARHALGQRQTANDILRGYDQGFVLRKRGEHASAPWIVSLGPVAVIAFVHCCLHGMGGSRSVHRLCEHLARYGIRVDRDDVATSDLGSKLRMLGLVLDSPDAEHGMLLLPPFQPGEVARHGGRE